MSRILVVDDEPEIIRTLAINLKARRFEVTSAADGASALRAAAAHPPDFVVLDLGLPDMDGIEVIHGLRGWTSVPILVLSGRTDSADKVDALDAGADDYLTKPFSMDELLARLRALSRRSVAEQGAPVVQLGDLTVDLAARTAIRADGDQVHLTATEWQLFDVLLRHPGKLLTRRQLLTQVWGPSYAEETNYLRVYMTRLRSKVEPDPARPRYLHNEHGMGYRYEP